MNHLLESQIKPHLHHSKEIEQFLGKTVIGDYEVLRWISIVYNKDNYKLLVHEVFDDRDEGIESIYDFSYFTPDDQFGRQLFISTDLNEVLEFAVESFGVDNSKYSLFGNLDANLIHDL
ncbi:MAG: hypothetical protein NXI10_02805 [bacterium]|nr:hypothetical protein [bacterium]